MACHREYAEHLRTKVPEIRDPHHHSCLLSILPHVIVWLKAEGGVSWFRLVRLWVFWLWMLCPMECELDVTKFCHTTPWTVVKPLSIGQYVLGELGMLS